MSNNWQQYFPTYSFDENKNRDIALEEYRACCKILENEEKIFDNLVKYIIVVGTAIISLITGMSEKIFSFFRMHKPIHISFFIISLIFLLFIFMTKNFSERKKSIIFAKRKIIILRRMLGIDYGTQEFLFKKGRFEGATMPFSIKLSSDYYLFFPIPVLCIISILCIGYTVNINLIYLILISIFSAVIILFLYRYWTLDLNENMFLVIFRILFRFLGLEFVDNFELVLYRAKLSKYEIIRHGINLDNLKKVLMAIEDKNFKSHKGIDCKALIRASISYCRKIPIINKIPCIKRIPYSGGSTITQQLFRTLFIKNMNKNKFIRKIAEILFSRFWFNHVLIKKYIYKNKEEELEIYLASVRFEKNVYGILSAMKHFYGNIYKTPTIAQSFFLVERISVVSGKMLPKIIDTINRLKADNIINNEDIKEINKIYNDMVENKKVIENKEILKKLGEFI